MSDLESQTEETTAETVAEMTGETTAESPTEAADSSVDSDGFEPTTASIIEALLFATDEPLPARKIAEILEFGDARDVKKHVEDMNADYEQAGRSFRIESLAGGFQMMTLPAFNNWLTRLLRVRKESKLSGAAMETLAVIAYRQPVLRADIEAIRGVAVGDMVNRLREANLVKIVGRAEEPGRPLLYGTTKRFLEVFGLASLKDLPPVDEAFPMPVQSQGAASDDQPQVEQVSESEGQSDDAASDESTPSTPVS